LRIGASSRHSAEEVVADAAQFVERLAPNLECECLAPEGKAGDVLLEHSSDASLVVVGRHSHSVANALGPVGDVLIGSVSQQVVRGARCPVTVVPHASSSE
jgi:nucleotide-binding universal stress UspA family protein